MHGTESAETSPSMQIKRVTTVPLTCNVTNTRMHTQRHTHVHALAPSCGFQNGRLPGIHHQLQTEFLPCKSH